MKVAKTVYLKSCHYEKNKIYNNVFYFSRAISLLGSNFFLIQRQKKDTKNSSLGTGIYLVFPCKMLLQKVSLKRISLKVMEPIPNSTPRNLLQGTF